MMNKKVIYKIEFWLMLLLFCTMPFIQSAADADKAERLSINILPSFVTAIAVYMRIGLLILILACMLFDLKRYFRRFTIYNSFFVGFYSIQLFYSLATNSEVDRYAGLTLLFLLLPLFVYECFLQNKNSILKSFRIIIYMFLILALVLNIEMVTVGQRFQGFLNNSNLYGITAVFWLVILLMPFESETKKMTLLNNVFISIVIITVFLSGSRNALLGTIVVMIFHYRTKVNPSLLLYSMLVIGTIYTLSYYYNFQFIFDRLLNIENSVEDSGRKEVWDKAAIYIKQNLLWGNGMDANRVLLQTGNVHNGYIRYILSMGLVFTILSFSFYVLFFLQLFASGITKYIPGALVGFLVVFTIVNIGEDFFVGIGSSVIIYLNIVLGAFLFYYKENKYKRYAFHQQVLKPS